MNNSNVIQQLNRLTPTKSNIGAYVGEILEAVEDGEIDPLQVKKTSALLQEIAKQLNESDILRDLSVSEIEKHCLRSGEGLSIYGVKFIVKETGVKYDYTACGDRLYSELKEIRDNYDAKLKEREKYLQRIPTEGITTVDEETGEIHKIYPPARMSTTGVSVTIPK